MAKGVSKECTKEGTGLVARYDVGASEGDFGFAELVKPELGFERVQGKSTTDESAVVANHHSGRASHGGGKIDSPVVDIGWSGPVLGQVEETHCGGGCVV